MRVARMLFSNYEKEDFPKVKPTPVLKKPVSLLLQPSGQSAGHLNCQDNGQENSGGLRAVYTCRLTRPKHMSTSTDAAA